MTNKKQPKQARAKARVEKILSCTEDMVIVNGFSAVSTTAIAAAANVPVGSIYQYFDGKDDILIQLYNAAYRDIEMALSHAISTETTAAPFDKIAHTMLNAFWSAAKEHPSFRPLTRWANSQRSLWETTPTVDSSLGELINKALHQGGVTLPPNKKSVILTITVTVVSVVIDLAIEEKNDEKASAIIEELVTLLSKYFHQ